jgi:ABC-2 type transport system permease protein
MWKFARYELNHWLRTPMLWIFLGVITLLVMGAVSSDSISIGGGIGSVKKNAPYVIQSYYGVMSLLTLLMVAAFMNATANRDFSTGMYQFVFTSPIEKHQYFFGKFIGALIISWIPLLGVTLGALIGPYMPWATSARFGPVFWDAHIQGFLGYAIPNTIITGVALYALAISFRSSLVSFVGAMMILVFYAVSGNYTADIEKEWLANILDPFGMRPFDTLTKYMTVDEKNITTVPLTGQFLYNRLIWTALSLILLAVIYLRFGMTAGKEKKSKKAKKANAEEVSDAPIRVENLTPRTPDNQNGLSLSSFIYLTKYELKNIVRNQSFIIILIIGMINLIATLVSTTTSYGNAPYPVTYEIVDYIRGSFYLFLLGIITFYSGVLVWRDRDAKLAEIKDATPMHTLQFMGSKILALIIALIIIQSITIVLGVITQAASGYFRFDLSAYVTSLLVFDVMDFSFLIVLSVLIHYLINQRYIAYFVFVVFIILDSFIWSVLKVSSNMLSFASTPSTIYSDMNGFGPFIPANVNFYLYWVSFCAILCFAIYYAYVRSKDTDKKWRWHAAKQKFGSTMYSFGGSVLVFGLIAGWVFYNTQILNPYKSQKKSEKHTELYELNYKKYQDIAQPKWIDFDYQIDIHPEDRNLYVKIDALCVNKSDQAIDSLHYSMPSLVTNVELNIPNGTLVLDDKDLKYRIYALSQPLQPGDTMHIQMSMDRVTKGFQNEVGYLEITHNGSFFNNLDLLPAVGYDPNREWSDKNEREKRGLPPRKKMPDLDPDDHESRSHHFLGSNADWVTARTTISTAGDQIAIAPGSLKKQWTESGRNYFQYELDRPSVNFYAFMSGRYEVAREKWNDIDLEVYYIKEHEVNVPNMMNSMRKSLEYFTENFGPYYHKQCRIIEFPRYQSFAQAFPGTMPYSEGIGFITDLTKVEEEDIDFVFYVVAHEMGHQWWAHQLIGAGMQGSIMMSECFTQYAALMVMEQEYGKDKMHKFLRYEMNGYLRGRGRELEAERPIKLVEGQGYIYYQKGSIAMYYLKEMIGEENVNRALRMLIDTFAYAQPPYPTSLDALEAFRAVTPDSLLYVIDDLFENITLFNNRIVDGGWKKKGGQYEVTFKVQTEKFTADSLGTETAVAIRDYIDIAVFAKPQGKAKFGKPLVYKRVLFTTKDNEFSFLVDEEPYEVGIDPYNYLIDRLPADNVKRVVKE